MEGLIDSAALALHLSMPVSTVQRYTREKKIPCVKVGSHIRYRLSDVLKALEAK